MTVVRPRAQVRGMAQPDPGVDMRRVAAVAALVLGLLARRCDGLGRAPLRVTSGSPTGPGRSGSDRAQVQAAIDRLRAEAARLFVVYVENFDGRERAGVGRPDRPGCRSSGGATCCWRSRSTTAPTASRSPRRSRCPTTSIDDIVTRDVEPRLAADDWAGAAVALADGLRTGGRRAGRRRRGRRRCRSGWSAAGSRWSAAGRTCWPRRRRRGQAGAGRRPRSGAPGARDEFPARPPTSSPTGPAPR